MAGPTRTAVLRGGTAIAQIVTPWGEPTPSTSATALGSGTLWIDTAQLGPTFTSRPGHAGLLFASASLQVSGGLMQVVGGNLEIDAAATLTITLTSQKAPRPAELPGQTVSRDFLDATLTPCAGATVTLTPGGAAIALDGPAEVTLYGQSVSLTPSGADATALTTLPTSYAMVPCAAAEATFTASTSVSRELALSGTGNLLGAGVVFPIAENVAPADLTDPGDAWGVDIELDAGLRATVAVVDGMAPLDHTRLCLTPTRLSAALLLGPRRTTHRLDLWQATTGSAPPVVAVEIPPRHVLGCEQTARTEELRVDGAPVEVRLDRPVGADGERLHLHCPQSFIFRTRDAAAADVAIRLIAFPVGDLRTALVAENALIPVRTPRQLTITGTVEGSRIAGELVIEFPAQGLVPTLPDPYITTQDRVQLRLPSSTVTARVRWTASGGPVVSLELPDAGLVDGGTQATGEDALQLLDRGGPEVAAEYPVRLLDISTNGDLWGVGVTRHNADLPSRHNAGLPCALAFDGVRLIGNAGEVIAFTVPGISWEPIVSDNVDDPPDWLAAYAPDDGTPTTFVVACGRPVPLVPADLLDQYGAAAGRYPTAAWFTLPFGIRAGLRDPAMRHRGLPLHSPRYAIPAVSFPDQGLDSALSLSIRSRGTDLPGWASVGYTADPKAYGAIVIGNESQPGAHDQGAHAPIPAYFWDQEFAAGGTKGIIPISRIDLSGYGTSLFSTWSEPSANAVGVVRADFDVLLGRTGHEMVQFQTWILPWCVRLQRSVIFDRDDGGEVLRYDSGWRAVGDGEFVLLSDIPDGPVTKVTNIRNVVFDGAGLPPLTPGGPEYAAVRFDATVGIDGSAFDVAIAGVPHGATPAGIGFAGYAPITVGFSPTSAEILTMMRRHKTATGSARLTGAAACTVTRKVSAPVAGGENFRMEVNSAGVALSGTRLQTALFGTPHLSKQGQWSVSRRGRGNAEPGAVDAAHPVPLTRSFAGGLPPAWRMLDPEDAGQAHDPDNIYGLIQGAGTSKTLFEHASIPDANALAFEHTPKLADVGALLGTGGIFPGLSSALDIGKPDGLRLAGGGVEQTYEWDITDPDRTLISILSAHIVLSYKAADGATPTHGRLSYGPGSWSLNLGDLTFIAMVDGYGPILAVTGSFVAGSGISPGVRGPGGSATPAVKLEGVLAPISGVLSELSQVAAATGGEVLLDVAFTGNQLTVRQGFTLPPFPLGFGTISDVGVDLGFSATVPTDIAFHLGIGSHEEPFHWIVSPLAGTGAIVLGVKSGDIDVYIEAGLGVGLEIAVAIASGGASIVLSLSVEVNGHSVDLGVTLTGEAHVDVLGGVASASITLSAAIDLDVHFAAHYADATADIAVGIHVHIAFVISCDFEGSWAYSERLNV